jgi:acetoacetate decarboxylase
VRGYSIPRTETGLSSLVPSPPWHYVGDFLVVDYWADPDAVRSILPEGLEPHEDTGRCAAVFADWQSCSAAGDELLDPVRSHYKEFFIVANAMLGDEEVTTCPFIWVDQDFALVRGWIQGFPKKLGEVWMTRTFGLGGPADPGLASGARHGATCSARGRAIADMTLTIDGPAEDGGPHHNAPPIVNVRHFPRLAAGRHDEPQVHELVRAVSRDRIASPVYAGEAELNIHAARGEEHDILAPIEIGRGYRFTFAYTVDDLETVKELT